MESNPHRPGEDHPTLRHPRCQEGIERGSSGLHSRKATREQLEKVSCHSPHSGREPYLPSGFELGLVFSRVTLAQTLQETYSKI